MNVYNWDIVYAASCYSVNEKLKSVVGDFYNKFKWSDKRGSTITGQFGNWEIIPGGSAQRLSVSVPIITGNLKATIVDKHVDVNMDGLQLKLQIDLALASGRKGRVVVLDSDQSSLFSDDNSIIPDVFSHLIADMIIAEQEKLERMFAEILIVPGEGEAAWFELQIREYAYSENINGELGGLAVLGILKNNIQSRSLSNLQAIFDNRIVRRGGTTGFIMSKHVFMNYIIMPGLDSVFKGINAEQLDIDHYEVITNKHEAADTLNKESKSKVGFGMRIIADRVVINHFSGIYAEKDGKQYTGMDIVGYYAPTLTTEKGKYVINLVKYVDEPAFIPKFIIQGINALASEKYITCGLADNFFMQD